MPSWDSLGWFLQGFIAYVAFCVALIILVSIFFTICEAVHKRRRT